MSLEYLRLALLKFGHPRQLVTCVHNLMADNVIRINMSGYFSEEAPKLRGLKQRDPISPILYNLAFKLFLLSILSAPDYHGYKLGYLSTKVLCYVDDAFAFVHDQQDLNKLVYLMELVCSESNANFNNDKVQAFLVSGQDTWDVW